MKNSKIIIAALIVAVAAGAGYLYSTGNLNQLGLGQSQPTEEAAALVNGEIISQSDYQSMRTQVAAQQGMDVSALDEQTAAQLKEQTLDILISRTLLQQAAAEAGATASQEAVTGELDALKNQLGGQDAFQEALTAQNMSEEELRNQIQSDLTTQAYLDEAVDQATLSASEQEITAAYETAAAGNEEIPPLEEVYEQVEQSIIRQKEQANVQQLIQELRSQAEIEILI